MAPIRWFQPSASGGLYEQLAIEVQQRAAAARRIRATISSGPASSCGL